LLRRNEGIGEANNPWEAKGLEWTTTPPPPKHNFEHTPSVDYDPYAYPNVTPET
jgi:cytochrome c oxidase subunit I